MPSARQAQVSAPSSVSQTPPCFAVGAAVSVDGAVRTWGDVDCSGAITIGDAQKVARSLVGLPVTQEDGCEPIGQPLP